MGIVESGTKKDYILTIRIPISGIDDGDARIKSKELISGNDFSDVKLQEIFRNKPPRTIRL